MATKEDAARAIELAAKHAGDNDSAKLCLRDARELVDTTKIGDDAVFSIDYAIDRAAASLAHSVGVFSPVYQEVNALRRR